MYLIVNISMCILHLVNVPPVGNTEVERLICWQGADNEVVKCQRPERLLPVVSKHDCMPEVFNSLGTGHWHLNLAEGVLEGVGEEEAGAEKTRRLFRTHCSPMNVNKQVLKISPIWRSVCAANVTKCRLQSWTSKRRNESSPPHHLTPKSSCTRRFA